MSKAIKYWYKDERGQISRLFVYRIEKVNDLTIYRGKIGRRNMVLYDADFGIRFSPRKEDLENAYEYLRFEKMDTQTINVYTKKTKKELLVGTINIVANTFGENKFLPTSNIFFGKYCLRELALFLERLDKNIKKGE